VVDHDGQSGSVGGNVVDSVNTGGEGDVEDVWCVLEEEELQEIGVKQDALTDELK